MNYDMAGIRTKGLAGEGNLAPNCDGGHPHSKFGRISIGHVCLQVDHCPTGINEIHLSWSGPTPFGATKRLARSAHENSPREHLTTECDRNSSLTRTVDGSKESRHSSNTARHRSPVKSCRIGTMAPREYRGTTPAPTGMHQRGFGSLRTTDPVLIEGPSATRCVIQRTVMRVRSGTREILEHRHEFVASIALLTS